MIRCCRKLALLLLILAPLSVFTMIDARYMKAFGRSSVELYHWKPEFDREHHCIFTEFFFRSGYRDAKEDMEKAGFDTSASTECTKWTEWCVLRIDPRNVSCIEECSMDTIIHRIDHLTIMELCELNE